MSEIFGVFNLPSWANWLIDNPFLVVFAGVCVFLLYTNFKAKLEERQFTLSKESANYIVVAAIAIVILIAKL